MSAVSSSPIPAMSAKLDPLNPNDVADLRVPLEGQSDFKAGVILSSASAFTSGWRPKKSAMPSVRSTVWSCIRLGCRTPWKGWAWHCR